MSAAATGPKPGQPRRRHRRGRRARDRALAMVAGGFTALGVLALAWILGALIWKGGAALSPNVFLHITPGPGTEGGGLANAILGSFLMTAIAMLIAAPVGMLAGAWLAEYGGRTRLAALIRFVNDILLSAPSILIGLFVYTLMVAPFGGYSGWAGAAALAIIALPVIVRSTEDMMRLVPPQLREAGAALGAPRGVVIRRIVWRAARAGMITGALLAASRIAGETAPLLFTALNNNFWFSPDLSGGVSNLPVAIYQFAGAPYDNWQGLAWAGSLLIAAAILALSLATRLILNRKP